jgi:hypothetical protein
MAKCRILLLSLAVVAAAGCSHPSDTQPTPTPAPKPIVKPASPYGHWGERLDAFTVQLSAYRDCLTAQRLDCEALSNKLNKFEFGSVQP